MAKLKIVGKYLFRFFLFLLFLLVLIAAILQIPAVQNYVAGKAITYLEDTLNTEVKLKSIHLRLPESLVIEGFYMEDLNQDTLVNVGELAVNFTLNQLLQKRIQFDEVTLKNGTVNIHTDENGSANFDFITEAFAPTDSTSVSMPQPTLEEPAASPWELTFNDANLNIETVDIEYVDKMGAIDFQGFIGNLNGSINDIDLLKGIYEIEELGLANSNISLNLGESETPTDTSETFLDYTIFANNLNIEKVNFGLKMPTLEVTTYLNKVAAEKINARLEGEDIGFNLSEFLIEKSDFAYDVSNTKIIEKGFDPNHFAFKNIDTKISNFDYQNMNIEGNIEQLHLEDSKGFVLDNLTSELKFSEDYLMLKEFLLTTEESIIKSDLTEIQYPFLADSVELNELLGTVDILVEKLAISDLHYLIPDLNEIEFFRKNKGKYLAMKAVGSGNVEDFEIEQFELNNWNTKIKLNGTAKNLLDLDNAYFDVKVNQFRISDKGILDWLPPNTLPEYVELPNVISFVGKFKGKVSDFNARLNGQTKRKNAPIASELEVTTRIRNIMDLERAFFDIKLDSFYTTRADFQAYLPPDAIPEYIKLPNKLLLTGTAKGTLKNLNSDFKLLSVREGKISEFLASGSVSDLLSGNIGFNIKLESAELTRHELLAFLPDSLLPAYFKLPFINKITGIIQGNTQSFESKISFQANGNWTANASLEDESYNLDVNVENLDLEAFFTNNYLDTLVGFAPAPWTVDLHLDGKGMDFSQNPSADFEMQVRKSGQEMLEGLVVKGKLTKDKLFAKASAKEVEINLESDLAIDFSKPIPEIKYDLHLERLDLQELGLAKKPFVIRGDLLADIKGYTLDTLSGIVNLKNVDVLYDSTFQQIDFLDLEANLDNGENLIDITSDVFDAHLEGYFKYPEIQKIVKNYYQNYLKSAPTDTLYNDEKAKFFFVFDLHRPELLTSGLVDGLQGLSPFILTTSFDNQKDKLEANAKLNYLKYQDAVFDSIQLNINANRDFLNYGLSFQNAEFQEFVDIVNFKMDGNLEDKQLTNNFEILDRSGKKRYDIKSVLEILPDNFLSFKLAESQLLNYENWKVSPNNELVFGERKVMVENWKFYKNKQFIQIANEGETGLKLDFNNFDLEFISEMIKRNGKLVDGILNGEIILNDLMTSPIVETDIRVENLVVLEAKLGNLRVDADNLTTGKIRTNLTLKGKGNDIAVNGFYDLNSKFESLDFQLDMNSLSLKSIEPLTFGYLEKSEGIFKGNVVISGNIEQPSLLGKAHFENAAFDVGLLKTRLKLGDENIIFDLNAIEFDKLKIYDQNDQEGTVSAYLLTPDFREFILQTDIHVENFQVLNTTSNDSDLYYGKLIVDADVELRGTLSEPIIEVTASPEKDSDLTYIYTATSNSIISHEGIVEFVNPLQDNTRIRQDDAPVIEGASELNMKIIVRLSIDDNLKFKAIIDPITGDFFEGKAEGNIVFIQNPDESMEMTGKVSVVEGKYLFTYQNVVRREFEVVPGSALTWIGVPENPKLDVDILYKLKTSPYPLLATGNEDVNNSELSARRTFEVQLNVTGTASNTNISTSINYPDSGTGNSDITNAINQINQDPSQQNTQAFSLILFNGFLAQDVGNNDFQILGAQNSVNDLITAQLNNLANKYIKFVELDFGLEQSDSESQNTDFKVSIRKRFLNDRLTISVDGKTTSQQENEANQSFLDNITVDYSLTPDGKYKIKIYNQQEFDDYAGVAGIKVGGAFVFSKDFNEIRLFKQKKEQDK